MIYNVSIILNPNSGPGFESRSSVDPDMDPELGSIFMNSEDFYTDPSTSGLDPYFSFVD